MSTTDIPNLLDYIEERRAEVALEEMRLADEMRAHARNTDPTTSHAAARSVRNQTDTHERILDLLERFGDATDEELVIYWRQMRDLADWPAISPSGLRSRRAELVDLGLVVDTGRRGKTASGRSCIVWDRAGVL